MGNSISEKLTPGSLKQAETNLLGYSGLPLDWIQVIKVPVIDENNYLTTIFAGDKTMGKPVLVLIHGFAGSSALFYKIMRGLAEHFYVIMFDIIGMGSSSRPQFNAQNYVEANQFML